MAISKILIIIMGLLFSYAVIINPTIAVSSLLLIGVIIFCVKIEIEHYLLLFILVYPILPFHAGMDIGSNLPVIRLHRLLLLSLILCWVNKRKISTNLRSFFGFPLTHMLWIMIPIYLLSYLSRMNFKGWIFFMGNFFLENFMIAFIFYDVLKNKTTKDIKRVFFFVAASALVPVLLGLVEYISGFNVFSKIEPYRDILKEAFPPQTRLGALRVRGPFIHSISYGLFFAMTVPSGLFLFALGRANARKRFLMLSIFLLICFTGSYMSLSRIAFLVFCLNTFILLFFSNVVTAIIFSLLIFLIFTQPFLMYNIKERVTLLTVGILGHEYHTTEMASSAYGRIEQLNIGLKSILNTPFLGTGGFNTISIIDNNYLSLIWNSGILGLISYLLFFILPMMLALKMFIRPKDLFYKNISFYTIIILVNTFLIFSVLSLTDYLYMVWIYIGIFMASHSICKKENIGISPNRACA